MQRKKEIYGEQLWEESDAVVIYLLHNKTSNFSSSFKVYLANTPEFVQNPYPTKKGLNLTEQQAVFFRGEFLFWLDCF